MPFNKLLGRNTELNRVQGNIEQSVNEIEGRVTDLEARPVVSAEPVVGPPGPPGPPGRDGVSGSGDGSPGSQGPQGERGPQGFQGIYRFVIYRAVSHGATAPTTPTGGSVSNGTLTAPTSWSTTFPSTQVSDPANFDVYESFAQYNPANTSLGTWATPFKIDVEAGPPGPAGSPGRDGADGSPGMKGDKGDPGQRGERGLMGLQGSPGAKGDKGDTGSQGNPGPQGIQGLRGPAGSPDTGAQIVTKLTGLSGTARLPATAVRDLPTGGGTPRTDSEINTLIDNRVGPAFRTVPAKVAPDFLPSGHWKGTKTQFDAITSKEANKLFFAEGSAGTGNGGGSSTFVGLTDTPANYTGQAGKILQVNSGATALEYTDKPADGEKGDKGDQGERGPQGIQGLRGLQGNPGAKGDPGERGPQGLQGAQGNPGAKGDKGDPGNDGSPGQRGERGLQGNPGSPGATGPRGLQGFQGIYRFVIYRFVNHGATAPATPTGGSVSSGTLTTPSNWSETFPSTQVSAPATYDVYESFASYNPASSSLGAWSVPFKIDVEAGPPGPAGPKGDPGAPGSGGSDTGPQIVTKLEGLSGNARLNATAIRNLPAGTFTGLTDTPANFTGQAGKILEVNSGENSLVYADKPSDGAQGERGPMGLRGLQGIQGIQGVKGDTGSQGQRGLQGPKGDKGDTGDTGPASTIPGPKGDTGERGPMGLPGRDGSDGSPGQRGEMGLQGPQGLRGPQGNPGAKGDKGDTGSQGIQGLQGPKGDTGATGATGSPGAKGDKGDKGDPGQAGRDGLAGPKGDTGATGERGPAGMDGSDGSPGMKGDKGDTGSQGPQGIYRFIIYRFVNHGTTAPATPTGGSVSSGTLTAPTSWSTAFPSTQVSAPATYDVYESFASYNPASDSLGAWSTPFKIDVEAGPPGPAGPKGDKGDPGAPGGGGSDTGAQIVGKLQALTGTSRLDASAVKNLPAGTFSGLTDTPALTSGNANQEVRVNDSGTGLTYVEPGSGGELRISLPTSGWTAPADGADRAITNAEWRANNNIRISGGMATMTMTNSYVISVPDGGNVGTGKVISIVTSNNAVVMFMTATRAGQTGRNRRTTFNNNIVRIPRGGGGLLYIERVAEVSLLPADKTLASNFITPTLDTAIPSKRRVPDFTSANSNQVVRANSAGTALEFSSVVGPAGPKGDTGERGPQGIQGIQGVKGDTGSQGQRGLQGEKGDTGDRGPAGSPDTGAQIVTKLTGLSGTARLPATAVRDLPMGTSIDFSASNASRRKALTLIVEETTPIGKEVTATTRNSTKDVSLSQSNLTGVGGFSNATHFWIVDNQNRPAPTANAYLGSNRSAVPGMNITFFRFPTYPVGVVGNTLWVTQSSVAYSYNLTTRQRNTETITLGFTGYGGFTDGTTLWVVDRTGDNSLKAFNASTRQRDMAKDINILDGDTTGVVLAHDIFWVVNDTTNIAEAYSLTNKIPLPTMNINLSNRNWFGGFSFGDTIWFCTTPTTQAWAYDLTATNHTTETKVQRTIDRATMRAWLGITA